MTGAMQPFAEIYSRAEIIRHYQSSVLQAPESALLQTVVRAPGRLALLDLGVGAGRTAFFFLPFVRHYVGLDVAPGMIAACRERFAGVEAPGRAEFRLGDAAELPGCAPATFDVVLFSCNGLDCLGPAARAACLAGILRVLRPGGELLFSAHNVQAIPRVFGDGAAPHPDLPAARLAAIRRHNDPLDTYPAREAAWFWDGVYGDAAGGLRHAYVRPRAQVAALARLGFARLRVLSSETGAELPEGAWEGCTEIALHYAATKPGGGGSAASAE